MVTDASPVEPKSNIALRQDPLEPDLCTEEDAQHMVAAHSLGPAGARGHWQVHKVVRPQVPQPRSPVAQRGRVAKRRRALECHAECGQG